VAPRSVPSLPPDIDTVRGRLQRRPGRLIRSVDGHANQCARRLVVYKYIPLYRTYTMSDLQDS